LAFGFNGIYFHGDSTAWFEIAAIDVGIDGRIVAAGVTGGDRGDTLVFRLTPNGSLDPTFAGTGWRTIDLPGSSDEIGKAVLVGPASEIYVVSQVELAGSPYTGILVAKLNQDGSFDQLYGEAGLALVPPQVLAPAGGWASAAALQGNGQVVVAGAELFDTGEKNFLALRLTRDGDLDAAFGDNGIVRLATNPEAGAANSGAATVSLQMDGRVLLAGACLSANPPPEASSFCVARLNSDFIFSSGVESGSTDDWSLSQY
jgi:uncharacterized delta-60 repeat protein